MKIAVRGWPEQEPVKYVPKEFRLHKVRRRLLVVDTEAYPDQYLSLTFGSAKVVWLGRKELRTDPIIQEEVIFHADDLKDKDPAGYKTLVKYCQDRKLRLISQHEFCIKYLNRCTDFQNHKTGKLVPSYFMLVMFNMPFDISRLAYGYGKPQGASYKGGFSFRMFKPGDSVNPTFTVRSLDSRKSFIKGFNGLDVRTLVSALTDKSMTLRSAGEAFNVPEEYLKDHAERYDVITPEFIDYNRQDVTATAFLAASAIKQYSKNPVARKPQEAYSAASLGKAYLEAMNIPPLLARDVPKDHIDLGNMGSAFFGGRSECRIRNTPCPVTVLDFQSMYPTVNALMGLWNFVTASSIAKVDCTSEARDFFDSLTLDTVLDKATWRNLTGFALIKPDGDLLPVRGDYEGNGNWTVGLNYLHSDTPLWYSFPDLAASKILTGRTPEILTAYRLVPGPKLADLRPVKLLGLNYVNPAEEDFFTRVTEQRANIKANHKQPKPKGCSCPNCSTQTGLKCLSNGTGYGVYAEMNREDLDEVVEQVIYGSYDEPWGYSGTALETPGKYCYMPMASLITAAARLMLATLERMITNLGGSYVFTDTDSMAPIANGPSPIEGIHSLTLDEIQGIVSRINSLNPYQGVAGKSILKVEHTCYAYAISAKRYTLFNYERGKPVIPQDIDGDRPYKEHALGLYLNPADIDSDDRDWMRLAWQDILDHAHGIRPSKAEQAKRDRLFDRPALVRAAVTKPAVMDRFRDINGGRSYEEVVDYPERIKPFSFLLMASEFDLERGLGDRRVITGFSRDPKEWFTNDWHDLHNPDAPPLRIGKDIKLKTIGITLHLYEKHPESKSLAPDGTPCQPNTSGLLRRREVHVTSIRTIGKESNRLEEQQTGLIVDASEVFTDYGEPDGRVPAPVRRCPCGCGYPLPAGKNYYNKSHYRKHHRKVMGSQKPYYVDDIGEDWYDCLNTQAA